MIGEYGNLMIFVIVGAVVSCVLIIGSYLIADQKGDSEKLTAYECGFDAFEDARERFDVRFYLVGILFIIFDLEASYLFPWAMTLEEIGDVGFYTMIDFIVELCIGYVYAWRVGALSGNQGE